MSTPLGDESFEAWVHRTHQTIEADPPEPEVQLWKVKAGPHPTDGLSQVAVVRRQTSADDQFKALWREITGANQPFNVVTAWSRGHKKQVSSKVVRHEVEDDDPPAVQRNGDGSLNAVLATMTKYIEQLQEFGFQATTGALQHLARTNEALRQENQTLRGREAKVFEEKRAMDLEMLSEVGKLERNQVAAQGVETLLAAVKYKLTAASVGPQGERDGAAIEALRQWATTLRPEQVEQLQSILSPEQAVSIFQLLHAPDEARRSDEADEGESRDAGPHPRSEAASPAPSGPADASSVLLRVAKAKLDTEGYEQLLHLLQAVRRESAPTPHETPA